MVIFGRGTVGPPAECTLLDNLADVALLDGGSLVAGVELILDSSPISQCLSTRASAPSSSPNYHKLNELVPACMCQNLSKPERRNR